MYGQQVQKLSIVPLDVHAEQAIYPLADIKVIHGLKN